MLLTHLLPLDAILFFGVVFFGIPVYLWIKGDKDFRK